MKKILVIGASNSTTSINKTLATYAGSLIKGFESEVLDLNDFEMPIYSPELETIDGIPEEASILIQKIEESEGVIISFAEHNGSYSAAFKNILDWSSRQKQKLWSDKPVLMLSTSPGGRGGSTVLSAAQATFPHLGANIIALFSLPLFYENFDNEKGITDSDLKSQFESALHRLSEVLEE